MFSLGAVIGYLFRNYEKGSPLRELNQMKKSLISLIFASAATVCAASCAVLFFFACKKDYDLAVYHFNPGALITFTAVTLIASAVLALVSAVILGKKETVTVKPSARVLSSFASSLTALLLVYSSLSVIPDLVQTFGKYQSFNRLSFFKANYLTLIALVFALLSAVYFIFSVMGCFKKATVFLSLAPSIWAGVRMLQVYFSDIPMNDPLKSVTLVLYASLMLFLCEDVRTHLKCHNPITATFFPLLGLVCVLAIAVPQFALIFLGPQELVSTHEMLFDISGSPLCISIGLFALSRFIDATMSVKRD